MVLTIHAGLIGEITGFADPELFPLFGLPKQAAWPPAGPGHPSGGTPRARGCCRSTLAGRGPFAEKYA